MRELSNLTSQPVQILDIGARAGIHPRWEKLRHEFPVQITGFEADARECAALNERATPGVRFLPCALSSRHEERPFHLLVGEGSSSLFQPNYPFINRTVAEPGYRLLRDLVLPTKPLDAVLSEESIRGIDYIKIDTEGYELEILKGATDTLKGVFAVELEVWFNPVFVGAPLFREVDAFMASQGFTLFDLARSNCFFKRKEGAALGGPKGQLVAGDAIYFRDLAAFPPDSGFFEKDKLVRCLILLMQYAYYDVAMEFTGLAQKHGRVTDAEATTIRTCIKREGRRSMFDFPGKHTLEKLVKRLARWLTKFEGDYLGNW